MSWALKGLAAPLKNKVFNLKPEMTLGRQGDIVVPDTKSSAVHARIVTHEGKMYLTDNNSKNGTRIDGERIKKAIKLKAGLQFYIGAQGFEVIEIKDVEEDLTRPPRGRPVNDDETPPPAPKREAKAKKERKDPEITPPPAPAAEPPVPRVVPRSEPRPANPKSVSPPVATPASAPASAPSRKKELPPDVEVALEATVVRPADEAVDDPGQIKKRRYWNEILADFIDKNQENFLDGKRPISPLSPALVLEFVRGVQANTKWVIGYGPRKIGSTTVDLPIFEPGAPPVCFEILSNGDDITFKTSHPKLVTVNGEALDSHDLRVGDKIRINDTIIEVDFEE